MTAGYPRWSETKSTRSRRSLGIILDPMLSALMAYRSPNAPKNFRGLLELATNYKTREGWHAHEKAGYFAGATRQAKLLGYELETFWLHEPGLTKRRLSQILSTRNVQGLSTLRSAAGMKKGRGTP